MKMRKNWIVFLTFVSAVIIQASFAALSSADQTSIKEVKKEVADAAKTIKDYSVDQRNQAIQKVKPILDNLDARIDKLETQVDDNWDQMTNVTRQKIRATLRKLRKQRIEVAQWYGGLKHSSSDAWEDLKNGFSNAYNALADAWRKAEQEFNSM